MKKLIQVVAFSILTFTAVVGLQSFTSVDVKPTNELVDGPVQFKLLNDSQETLKFCVNGNKYAVEPGHSHGMSFVAGTSVKHSDGTDCGALWFKIAQKQHGTSVKASELK